MRLILTFLVFLTAWAALQKSVDVTNLLEDSDRARGGLEGGVTWNSEIETMEEGETSTRKFTIKALGDDALAVATAPARSKGEVFLFNDRTMWFHRSGLRKPVSVSPRQRLSGQAANGDIATTRYARDYQAGPAEKATVDGQEAYVLDLKSKTKNATYDRIRYWISANGHLGLKAEFLSLEGKPLKTAAFEYGNKIETGSGKAPFISRMVITDAKNPKNRSTLIYSSPAKASLSAGSFNVNNLGR